MELIVSEMRLYILNVLLFYSLALLLSTAIRFSSTTRFFTTAAHPSDERDRKQLQLKFIV
jgi:hypothetical protein